MKDCERPQYERCGECEKCVAISTSKEIIGEAKKELRGCTRISMGLLLAMMALCVAMGAGIGLVYLGFRLVIDLLGNA